MEELLLKNSKSFRFSIFRNRVSIPCKLIQKSKELLPIKPSKGHVEMFPVTFPDHKFRLFILSSSAEITGQLHSESTFGHVKLQKLMFLCEHASNMDLNDLYLKKTAGPFDNKFMHTIDKELAKQKWFAAQRKKSGGFSRIVYQPLENWEGYKKYFLGYFKKSNKTIQFLIDTFRTERTRQVELVATIFACWIELTEKKMELNQPNLFKLFYSWAEEKQKFTNEEVMNTLEWMKEQKITPQTL